MTQEQSKTQIALGLMSGTSMDGIDAALIETDGQAQVRSIAHYHLAYTPAFQQALKRAEKAVFAARGDLEKAKETLKPSADLPTLIRQSTELHGHAVATLLTQTSTVPAEVSVIGYHGQTFYHNPAAKISLQVGCPQLLAQMTQCDIVAQFRQNDLARGGQGAPLAPLYHFAKINQQKLFPAMVINCGGIANITAIPDNDPNHVCAFDTGPGNTLLDRFVRERTSNEWQMDHDGQFARKGKIDPHSLDQLFKYACAKGEKNYFEQTGPKSLDINDLQLIDALASLSLEDGCATLTELTALTIADSLDLLPYDLGAANFLLLGGGCKNQTLKDRLKKLIEQSNPRSKLLSNHEIDWHSQAIEAECFAYLAVRSLLGLPLSFPQTTGVPSPLTGGTLTRTQQFPATLKTL